MKRFLVFCLSLSVLTISISIAYYFVIYIPKKDQVKLDQQAKVEAEKSKALIDCSQRIATITNTSSGAFLHYQDLMKICLQGKGYSN